MTDPRAGRPLIGVPARFSRSASALRYEAEVNARKLVMAVYAAGGEPLSLHPHAPGGEVDDAEVEARLGFLDGILLPGGGDIAAKWSGQPGHPSLYDVDEEQDAFDLAVARVALRRGIPLLAVCRGLQVVNVARGGTLHADMTELGGFASNHRHHVHDISAEAGSLLAEVAGPQITVSCYHHQCIDRLGSGLRPVAFSEDGVVEGVTSDDAQGWFLGVQWHPEDTAGDDRQQHSLFAALVEASARYAAQRRSVPVS